MFKRIAKSALSIVLILSMCICSEVFASVFVAGAPTNNAASNYGLAGSNVLGSMQSVQGAASIYPGSLNEDDAPKTVNITSPAANNAKTAVKGGKSQVITNGYEVKVADDNKAPVSRDITSPAAHMAEMNSDTNGVVTGTYNPNSMSYSAPTNNTTTTNTTTGNSTLGYSFPTYQTSQTTTTTQTTTATTTVNSSLVERKTGLADPVVTSDAAIVINGSTNEIYYQKNMSAQFPPVGIATLLTGYIALKNKGLDDILSVSYSAVTGLESGANTCGLKAGDTISLKDALHAMYVKSACDAANVIAENVSGSQAAFVNLMNQTAKSFGCVATNFMNCNGLNNDAQVTCAYDAAIIMNKATDDSTLAYLLNQYKYTLPATAHRKALSLSSKNSILSPGTTNYYPGVQSSRLGYTSKGKYTMASSLIYRNQKIVAVVLHSNGSQFVDTKRMFNFGKVVLDKLGTTGTTVTNTTAVTTTTTTNNSSTALASGTGWKKDNVGWYYIKADGTKATNQWIQEDGKRYCVDQSGYMITGWREFSNGNVYYFDSPSGEQVYNTWVNTSTGAYYLQADGVLAKAPKGQEKTISTNVGNYVIDENGKALRRAQ